MCVGGGGWGGGEPLIILGILSSWLNINMKESIRYGSNTSYHRLTKSVGDIGFQWLHASRICYVWTVLYKDWCI